MCDSKFWRVMALCAVVGIFYVGTALRPAGTRTLPSFLTEVHADDVGISSLSNFSKSYIVTTSTSGKMVFIWSIRHTDNKVRFLGSYPASPEKQ